MSTPEAPHADDRDSALAHFNGWFRHRYGLAALTKPWVEARTDLNERWDEIATVRASGVADASCAVLARIALSRTPRYAIGLIDGGDKAHVLSSDGGDEAVYRSHQILMVNPLGGYDNWREASGWLRRIGSEKARRVMLAGLASEHRRDEEAIEELLRAEPSVERAQVLPPDEGFSVARAAEVSYIYDVSIETLRLWKRNLRGERASGKVGRPRNR